MVQYVDRLVEVPGPERIVEVEKEVIKEVPVEHVVEKIVERVVEKEVPGPERIVERIVEVEKPVEVVREVPGPERVVQVEVQVPGPERIVEKIVKVPVEVIKEVIKEVPGAERVVNKIVYQPVKEIVEVPVYKTNPDLDKLLDWATGVDKLAPADDTQGVTRKTTFGIEFPRKANKGDFFLRVDTSPSLLYKYNGDKWIEVSKDQNGSYISDDYIRFLVERVLRGEIELEHLTADELEEVQTILSRAKPLEK